MKKTPVVLNLLVDDRRSTMPILECKNYSSLRRLLRVTALVLKFVNILKSKLQSPSDEVSLEITPEDMQEATVYWIKLSQTPQSEDE